MKSGPASIAVRGILLLAWLACAPAPSAATEGSSTYYDREIAPLLGAYCADCHLDGSNKGNVAFDEFGSHAALLKDRKLWLSVLKNLRAGIMPPENEPRPNAEELKKIETWIQREVFRTDPANPDPGRVTLRRLNRVEYRNTIRDLMGYDYNTTEEFPPDDTGYGFDNIGDVLTVSPLLLEKYMAAAETIVAGAVPTVSRAPIEQVIAGNEFREAVASPAGTAGATIPDRPPSAASPGPLVVSYYKATKVSRSVRVEQAGEYRVVLNLMARGDFNFDPGRCRLTLSINGRTAWENDFKWEDRTKFQFEATENWTPGDYILSLELHPLTPVEERKTSIDMHIVSVAVRGPMAPEQWGRPANFEQFFTRDAPGTPAARRAYAREVLKAFTTRAFRRPADAPTIERLVAIAEEHYREPGKTFEEGLGRAFVAVLASPRFVFRMEGEEAAGFWGWFRPANPFPRVDEYALASRLSYFLWSTMPDDELFQLARRGALRKHLPTQVNRMLKDPRADELVRNFTGQWLQVRDVETISIDARTVLARDQGKEAELRREDEEFRARIAAFQAQAAQPATNRPAAPRGQFRRRAEPAVQLDTALRRAMEQETELYFAHLMREDRSVLELLDSNYTFLNAPLAKLYGIEGVTGTEMRRVELPEGSPRGGVLTQGSVLVVTSNPTRTSPVKRGLFVLDNILGTPPPPPPADVPLLEDSEKAFPDREPTLKEVLAIHRENALCSSCHARMDPLGLALENFNALGMWRDQERNQPIETPGQLITGEAFRDIRELKQVLARDRRQDFYHCLTEKLLTYALGRGLDYRDVTSVDQIVAGLNAADGRFSALLMGIIESAPFQKRRGASAPPDEPIEESVQPLHAKLATEERRP